MATKIVATKLTELNDLLTIKEFLNFWGKESTSALFEAFEVVFVNDIKNITVKILYKTNGKCDLLFYGIIIPSVLNITIDEVLRNIKELTVI